MKPSVSVALAAAVSLALAATGANAQVVAASDAIPTPQTPWFVPDSTPSSTTTSTTAMTSTTSTVAPSQAPACASMASISVRGSVGRDGAWHEAPGSGAATPSAIGGDPCDTALRAGDHGPTPQEPLVDGAPAPIAAPPPPSIEHAMLGAAPTPRRVVYTYRVRLHALDRSSSTAGR